MENEIKILLLIEKYKRKLELTTKEKMEIFGYVYDLSIDEIPKNINSLIDIILNGYDEDLRFSNNNKKQSFLYIYSEPLHKEPSLYTIDAVLDIFLNEIVLRNDLNSFYLDTNSTYLSPYSRENSSLFLLMKQANIYSTRNFDVDRLIGNVSHNKFPMNKDMLEDLQWDEEFNNYYSLVSGIFKNLHFTKSFSNDFTTWFNSYFWNEEFGQFRFNSEKKIFKQTYSAFRREAEVNLSITSNHLNIKEGDNIFIWGGNQLSSIGQEYLVSLPPFNTLGKTKIIFD